MLQVKTAAIVIDKEPGYNDEGKILALTKKAGIFRLFASGLYKPGSRLGAWTEPPSLVVADIALASETSKRGRLLTLSLRSFYPHIHSSYASLSWFSFYVDLLQHFLPSGVRIPHYFKLFEETLSNRDSWAKDSGRSVNFIYFLVKFLRHEGICPSFSSCVSCGKPWQKEEMAYHTQAHQGLVCNNCLREYPDKKTLVPTKTSLDFRELLPLNLPPHRPGQTLGIPSQERKVLEICQEARGLDQVYTNIFSGLKINDQVLARVRNFLLIFLGPVL